MNIIVNLGQELIKTAKSYSVMQNRSVPKQIEHWAKPISLGAYLHPDCLVLHLPGRADRWDCAL